MRNRWTVVGVATIAAVSGCNLLTPLAVLGEHKKKITAEFDKLGGARVATLIWTDPATLFDYPHARFELAAYLDDKLSYEMAQRKLDVDMVDPRDVEDFIQKSPEARVDPTAVGRQFKTDYVVYIEVVRFTVRDPDQPQFVQGHMEANVSVFDMRSGAEAGRKFALAPVECMYPDRPAVLTASNSALIRESLYRLFSEMVARKFYDHTVELQAHAAHENHSRGDEGAPCSDAGDLRLRRGRRPMDLSVHER